jgi:hypothetical protein
MICIPGKLIVEGVKLALDVFSSRPQNIPVMIKKGFETIITIARTIK